MPDPKAVNTMFARIAGRYDIANHLLSGGIDYWWRQRLVRAVYDSHAASVLDLATGSGDVVFALADGLAPGVTLLGMDFCQPMLDEAVKKREENHRWTHIEFRLGDGMALPLPDASFEAITISFGLRNMVNRAKALQEMRRVLKPDGRLFILEFSQPMVWFRPFYYTYLKYVLPIVAGIITGDRSAYEYLGGSIEQYPDRSAMSEEIRQAGFNSVRALPLSCGIVALHEARV
ncbi:MAG: bifunctional demethylmenaquinone methyltransferase/2-methoxy-6-polyprenyl-1,4-benzoquinol methylase UbiE [Opitutaceae bacterium]|jgi:demethylmenaquinone methyltransferase/2-methoxy-6-polyprenyl-1,4-benzoquinol methylase|nr:bifunctional demethylmenaquinone methyltransferase/2-methoxy-6-polyprenyl-1,4-benzoquinol methylase UbiE [Opitutaceae bacterium]